MSLPDFPHLADWIGTLAATLTTVAFIPQAWIIWKKRHAHDVSLGMYGIFTAGVALWLVYGWVIGAWPIIIANAVTFALALFILLMKIRFG